MYLYLRAYLLHELCARVCILVDAMAESHQAEGVRLVFCASDESRDVLLGTDLTQHAQHSLNTEERIGLTRIDVDTD